MKDRSERLWDRALRVIPAGTQTFSKGPGQYVSGVAPKYIQRGLGGRVWDPDGNEFIDYGMALGPIILGHAYPRVNEAIAAQLRDGITFTLMHPLEVELAEQLAAIVPCAEMVRFGKNGSDATAGAVRIARACTKRDKIACCGYHGWQDWYIGSTSRGLGVPAAVTLLTAHFEYNNIDSLYTLFRQHSGQIAAVVLEPVNFFPPRPGFLEDVKDLTHRNGAILVFDEVITGFRFSVGGAQALFGVVPDLAAFGKAMGNGMPISALVGKGELMRVLNDAFYSFTFAGEAVSLAASLATICEIREKRVLDHIWRMGARLIDGYNRIVAELGLKRLTKCIGYPCWPKVVFNDGDGHASPLLETLFQQEIVKRGILTRPGMFVCYSHGPHDVDETISVYRLALQVLAEAVERDAVREHLEGDIIEPVIRSVLQAPR
ncbi:MAG: aminotransferase class III-fold pyridoxal phosphate-dependent enzyme [Deltaproteobacteria bacterium]|nr:aminotransferase class III-fold pyridoxal phosphate-dependent enzyme [Deltaproteobacteria bacterium]